VLVPSDIWQDLHIGRYCPRPGTPVRQLSRHGPQEKDTITSVDDLEALITKVKGLDLSARSTCSFASINRMGLHLPFKTLATSYSLKSCPLRLCWTIGFDLP
jgi:hypothetical protein